MQSLENQALQRYNDITSGDPQFTEGKDTDEDRRRRSFRKKWQERLDFFYFLILLLSDSPEKIQDMLNMTTAEIVDYYLSIRLNG